jgi:predicted  nucleic acid-binding Zn-ribbon protein
LLDSFSEVQDVKKQLSFLKEFVVGKSGGFLNEKRIKEFKARIDLFEEDIKGYAVRLEERTADLTHKKTELDAIIAETQKEETSLVAFSQQFEAHIEDRYLSAYRRIRGNAFNGLAVVAIDRDSCGGCFNMIPPQRQLDIAQRKKVIVCEHCGRILVDNLLAEEESEKINGMINS